MSKESFEGQICACGQRIAFPEYHWPHCAANPNNLIGTTKTHMESKFSKSELASIATRGPMRDQPVRHQRGVGSRKPTNVKSKGKAKH